MEMNPGRDLGHKAAGRGGGVDPVVSHRGAMDLGGPLDADRSWDGCLLYLGGLCPTV